MILASRPKFLAIGNHLEPFSKVSHPPEGQEQGGGAVGGQEHLKGVKFVTLVLNILETLFWCQTQCFWEWGIICNYFQEPQMYLKVKDRVEGL